MRGTDVPVRSRLAVYIHWPFCVSKCPYCDFNSHAAAEVDQARWRRALLREIEHAAAVAGGRIVTSVFFGGGTPSLMSPETAAALIEAIRARWPVADDLEVSLEANPSSSEVASFVRLREAGVNRLSVGVQSLDDDVLAFLGRAHSASEARAAVAAAAKTFSRCSFDLIYGWAGHGTRRWRRELSEALALAGEHLSLYQLTIEPGTAFHRRGVASADEETGADLYELSNEILGEAGFSAYEISNHARPAAECRHNLAIWQGCDYVGVGPGAHGRISRGDTTRATQQHRLPERWLAAVESRGHGTAADKSLTRRQRREELVLTGLRLNSGLERSVFRDLTGLEPEQAVDGVALERMTALGLSVADRDGLRLTPAGLLCLDAVTGALLSPAA